MKGYLVNYKVFKSEKEAKKEMGRLWKELTCEGKKDFDFDSTRIWVNDVRGIDGYMIEYQEILYTLDEVELVGFD